jgi:nickel transport protein
MPRIIQTLLRTAAPLALALLLAAPAQAHKALFFAYMDGADIVCEGGFPGGKACKECPVTVFDAATGGKLAEGRTDQEGILRLPVPTEAAKASEGLRLVLDGGEGHRAEWLLEPGEFLAAMPEQPPAKAAQPAAPKSAAAKPAPAEPAPAEPVSNVPAKMDSQQAPATVDMDALRTMIADAVAKSVSGALEESVSSAVRAELQRELTPIRRELAAATETGPSLTDILGGLGWIIGMGGIVAWARSRRAGQG